MRKNDTKQNGESNAGIDKCLAQMLDNSPPSANVELGGATTLPNIPAKDQTMKTPTITVGDFLDKDRQTFTTNQVSANVGRPLSEIFANVPIVERTGADNLLELEIDLSLYYTDVENDQDYRAFKALSTAD